MIRSLSLMALFLCLAVGCGKKDGGGAGGGGGGGAGGSDDNARFQGSWAVASVDAPGDGPLPLKEIFADTVFTVSGNSVKLDTKGKTDGQAVIKLDASKSPKEIDLTESDEKGTTDPRKTIITVRDGKPEYRETPRETFKGVYKFEGDALVVGLGGPGSPRPTEFKPSGDKKDSVIVITFKKK